mmetsp:Transcript_18479/g.17587  ORF Transcript_18479/g.17587 Transcript_18479/m.17587 type:complete len:277 (-) Transcript_18479:314-1144(-)
MPIHLLECSDLVVLLLLFIQLVHELMFLFPDLVALLIVLVVDLLQELLIRLVLINEDLQISLTVDHIDGGGHLHAMGEDVLAEASEVLHDLLEVVLHEVDARLFALLEELEEGLVLVFELVELHVVLLDLLLVVLRGQLRLVLDVQGLVGDFLHLLDGDLSLLMLQQPLLYVQLALLHLHHQAVVLLPALVEPPLSLLLLHPVPLALVDLLRACHVVVLQVQLDWLDKVPMHHVYLISQPPHHLIDPLLYATHSYGGGVEVVIAQHLLFELLTTLL